MLVHTALEIMSRLSTNMDQDEDAGVISLQPERAYQIGPSALTESTPLAMVYRDAQDGLRYIRHLQSEDILILITPIVLPTSQDLTDPSDPFEFLGRSLAKSHARIRHVPYTKRNGITSTHVGFIRRGHAVILCLAAQPLQLELADVVLALSGDKPVIVVICCTLSNTQQSLPFPTVIQAADYSRPSLEAIAASIFAERSHPLSGGSNISTVQPKVWPVEDFDEQRDMATVVALWSECFGAQFTLDQQTFTNVLRKPGYSKHYVVRSSPTGEVLGFCATYLSYIDREGERLVASLAILVVHPRSRLQGIGLSLHSHAIAQLKRTRGIIRLQLGSTFPRILYGPPSDIRSSDEWFRRRGWQLDKDSPGQGKAVYDLLLQFIDWKYCLGSSSSTEYRLCTQDDMTKVIDLVEKVSTLENRLGWFDQYWALNGPNVKAIVVAIHEHALLGAALTYTPGGSQISNNLPWISQIGNNVGGVTCISILPDRREMILSGLINACVETLQEQGMKSLLLDAVTDHLQDLNDLGFKPWAQYRDVWKSV